MSRREFQIEEGSSRKFWAITTDGSSSFSVQFGRMGTTGQTQTKQFASDAEAQKAADKLIAEKTKKGYVELGAAPAPTATQKKAVETATTAAPPTAIEQPEWLRLPNQPWPRRPRPEALPFDLVKCLERLRRGVNPAAYDPGWKKCRIASTLTLPEARFWLEAMMQVRNTKTVEALATLLGKGTYDAPLSVENIVAGLENQNVILQPEAALPLSNLMSLEEFFDVIVGPRLAGGSNWRKPHILMEGFREYVLPHLTGTDAEKLRNILRPYLDLSAPDRPQIPWVLASCLEMRAELLGLVKTWKDGQFAGAYYHAGDVPHIQPFHLGDPHLVEEQFRRLKLPLITPEHVQAWLLITENRALDYVRDSILGATKKDVAEKLTKAFAVVTVAEAAPLMLELKLNSKAAGVARQWLDDHPDLAIAGLVPVAAGKGKLADAAREYLVEAKKRGFASAIEEQLKSAPPEAAAGVQQAVLEHVEKVHKPIDDSNTPDWLRDALAATPPSKAKVPDWARPTNLPPLLVGGHALREEQAAAVLAALQGSALGAPKPLVVSLRTHGDRPSLSAFAWKLFELWLEGGAPSKEKWAFTALAHFGDDAAAIRLTPLLRAWPGESQHQRAVTGLEVLRGIGSDTALMQLNGIAQKLKFKGLQNKARELMEAIAGDRGLTRDQLEDRIVPDLDLDERGGRAFDFGPRQFQFVLGPDLKPRIRDDAGKIKDDLPKPGAKDDADKANAAVAEWKLLKKQLRDALKVQAFRLEQVMVTGRRWSPTEFATLLVHHPLLVNLVRRLLWGGYDSTGKLVRTFRVTEEQEYADVEDRACQIDDLAAISLVHPLHLTEEQRSAWGQVFGDYEIISPFPQLGRGIHTLEPAESKGKVIQRLAKRKFPSAAVRGTLENLGWNRGSASDHGVIQEFFKPFPAAAVTAMLEVDPGIAMGMMDMLGDQKVTRVFLSGDYRAPAYPYHKEEQFLPLDAIDAVAMSEVLGDLTTLAAKGK